MRCEGWLRSAEKPWSRCSSSSFAMEHGPWLSELEQMRWQDPSCTCVLRCTNDNGCRPINHPICNGTQRWLLGEWVSGFPRGSRECREPMILCASLLLCWVYNSVSLYLIIQMNTRFATWLYMKISHFGQRSISLVVLGCGSAPLLHIFYFFLPGWEDVPGRAWSENHQLQGKKSRVRQARVSFGVYGKLLLIFEWTFQRS